VFTLREVKSVHRTSKNLGRWSEEEIVDAITQASQLKDVQALNQFADRMISILSELPASSVGGNGGS